MRTEEEIREKLIQGNRSVYENFFYSEYSMQLQQGAMLALKWVLEDNNMDECKRTENVETYKGMIDVDKYFKACPDGVDYEFQTQLTDHLLNDIFHANNRIKELQDNYKRFLARLIYNLTEAVDEYDAQAEILYDAQNVLQTLFNE
jgi:hypothetical protein